MFGPWVLVRRALKWIDNNTPVKCVNKDCLKSVPKKDAILVQHRVAGWVWVCKPCHRILYPDQYPEHPSV